MKRVFEITPTWDEIKDIVLGLCTDDKMELFNLITMTTPVERINHLIDADTWDVLNVVMDINKEK